MPSGAGQGKSAPKEPPAGAKPSDGSRAGRPHRWRVGRLGFRRRSQLIGDRSPIRGIAPRLSVPAGIVRAAPPRLPRSSTMTTPPTADRHPDQRVVLVADFDGEPLTVLSALEELLRDLAAWEESDAADPPQTREALRLPAPLAGGVALAAVRRLTDALRPTPCLGSQRGRLLGPDGSYAHTPLSVLILRSTDIDILAATARVLGRPGLEPDLVDVLTAYADRFADQLAGRCAPADRAEFVAGITGLAGLLDLAPTESTQLLVARLSAGPPGLDLALTDAEEAAYACTLDRMTAMWPHGWELTLQ